MSGDRSATDLGGEREINLARWRDAVIARWWFALAGLAAGVLIGGVYSLGGGASTYTASVLLVRGQAFAPGGTTTVLTYLTSINAINQIATSPTSLAAAAAKAGVSVGELRGHVTLSTVNEATGQISGNVNNGQISGNINSILVLLSVQMSRPKRAEDAANALAELVQKSTLSGYVAQSISIFNVRLGNYAARLKTLRLRIQSLNDVLSNSQSLAPLDRLVLVSELDQAEAAQGSTLDSQTLTQQQLILAKDVELTHVIQQATRAEKSTGRSRRNSVLVGALIGLIVGAMVAVINGLRASRAVQPT